MNSTSPAPSASKTSNGTSWTRSRGSSPGRRRPAGAGREQLGIRLDEGHLDASGRASVRWCPASSPTSSPNPPRPRGGARGDGAGRAGPCHPQSRPGCRSHSGSRCDVAGGPGRERQVGRGSRPACRTARAARPPAGRFPSVAVGVPHLDRAPVDLVEIGKGRIEVTRWHPHREARPRRGSPRLPARGASAPARHSGPARHGQPAPGPPAPGPGPRRRSRPEATAELPAPSDTRVPFAAGTSEDDLSRTTSRRRNRGTLVEAMPGPAAGPCTNMQVLTPPPTRVQRRGMAAPPATGLRRAYHRPTRHRPHRCA